ncbi:MAG TPA: 16S rRNA (cytosine(1402)-N(4))-methyltransferase RsmH [Tepidisphaeraceae bacterium]|jgi:16S rRNA (cytosine1402-N4)-methyltransferase|nr:16S rRNA (cytosine(1402)-N(4))-methyltransferase RsmH [Tepidisphaeraceae bacterium]
MKVPHHGTSTNALPHAGHDPVLLNETIELLQIRAGLTVVDCTTGRGGHAQAIARRLGPEGQLLALDADPRNLEFARSRLADIPCRTRFFQANFAELSDVLELAGVQNADAILADLGLSTNQLFDERYGLSFATPMPLDMRIDPRTTTTAADLVNKLREDDLANVLYKNADERYSRRISRKIVQARHLSPIMTTDRLAELVRSAIPSRGGAPSKIDPATRTFMALRMEVNHEVENLRRLLGQAPRLLKSGGRLAVISFQSTEDRQVKQAFVAAERAGMLEVITKKPLTPSEYELAQNPRSRSAKLRVAERRIADC